MHSATLLIGLAATVLVPVSLAVGQAPDKGGVDSQDARFTAHHDLDHPWPFEPRFADRAAWEKRAESLRQQARVALGLWPMPAKTALNPVIHGAIDRGDYTVEKVFFASLPGHYVSGNLYRPKGRTGKLPAVLAPYGHWPNGRFIWRNEQDVKKEIDGGAETDPLAAKAPLQATCAMLARMGCVVFHYDMVGYGDSKKFEHPLGFTDPEAALRLQSMMGLQTWNSVRSLDFVLGLPEVDPSRVAVTGSSSGGTQTIALDAVDRRTAVAFPMVMISMNMQGGCVCENAPLYRVGTNNVELSLLMAPRPEGAAAAKDWTHDFETRGLPEMKKVYALYGAEDKVGGKFVPFGHNHNLHSRELCYAFLNKHLKLGWPDESVKEKAFEPIDPTELSVYDADHPVPTDALDAAGVRAWMARASDEQLAALRKDRPEEYASVLRGALSAMVVDEMPRAEDVEAVAVSDDPAPQPGVPWAGVLSRRGAGERVPCGVVVPRDWNGTVVVHARSSGDGGPASAAGPEARKALDAGAALVVIEPFMGGTFKPATTQPAAAADPKKKPRPNADYAGYTAGYDRTVLAERVHDLLTAIAFARGWKGTKQVHLVATGDAGTWALLARGLAGEAVDRAAIDLGGLDFGTTKSVADPMFLPGALKYGGARGFAALSGGRPTTLYNVPAGGEMAVPGVTVEGGAAVQGADALVERVLK